MFGRRRSHELELAARYESHAAEMAARYEQHEAMVAADLKEHEAMVAADLKEHEAMVAGDLKEHDERLAARYEEQVQITRELMRRNEIAFREQSKVLGRQSEVLTELAKDIRAMRAGLLALIDELRGGGPNPATS